MSYLRNVGITTLPILDSERYQLIRKGFERQKQEQLRRMERFLQGLRPPRIFLNFFPMDAPGLTPPAGLLWLSNCVFIRASYIYDMTDHEVGRVICHETFHYIQSKRNGRHVDVYGLLTRSNHFSFTEGFAAFGETKIYGTISKRVKSAIEKYLKGEKIDDFAARYCKGLLAFLAISKAFSFDEAYCIGISSSAKEWKLKAREAFKVLSVESTI